jgi:starch synthase
MCPLGFCKIGKIRFSFNVLKETTDKLDLSYISLKFRIIRQKRCLRIKDDIERFYLSNSYFRLDNGRDEMPDVINCHDHHTGLIPFMMLYCKRLQNTPSMITIHNGLYQGNLDLINYIIYRNLI